jgi:hypothetical protein
MTKKEKKDKIYSLMEMNTSNENYYYDCLRDIGDLKNNYYNYLTTSPMDVEIELKRLPEADYALCAALLTMLLREDHFSNGSFERRYHKGDVTSILQRMMGLL